MIHSFRRLENGKIGKKQSFKVNVARKCKTCRRDWWSTDGWLGATTSPMYPHFAYRQWLHRMVDQVFHITRTVKVSKSHKPIIYGGEHDLIVTRSRTLKIQRFFRIIYHTIFFSKTHHDVLWVDICLECLIRIFCWKRYPLNIWWWFCDYFTKKKNTLMSVSFEKN